MDKAAPERECDIVMKGGITSGLVYPLAVVELSGRFRFRNVGGTSAGAIAAAATAAAELGRGQPGAGFELLAKLPEWLSEDAKGGGSRLLSLFQPQPGMRGLFGLLRAGLGPGHKLLNLGWAALWEYWPYAAVGLLPGLVLLGLAQPGNLLLNLLGGLAGLVVLALGALAGVGLGLLRGVGRLPDNGYGLCNGYLPDPQSSGPNPPLTAWLHSYLNRLAARPPDGPPLTFGDLQKGGVSLQMMTSNLTHGLPYRLPFETKIFYFDPEEFGRLFPPAVVAQMLEASGRSGRPKAKDADGRELYPLPNPADFPVVVAVRLSLSFPGLISALPLYAMDDAKRTAEQRFPPLERCWFSDGGITSNFPVHFFDTPLPLRPTFAINLIPLEGKKADSSNAEKVEVAEDNNAGRKVLWSRFDQSERTQPWQSWLGLPKLGQLGRFAMAVFTTAQNWVDNIQLPMPGYRDRIAHIGLTSDEGGLNLTMPQPVITELTERGQIAGQKLAQRFTAEPEQETLSWLNHRWVRYRATMASLEGYLFDLHDQYRAPSATGQPSFEELIRQERQSPANSYALKVFAPKGIDQRGFMLETMADLMDTVERWKARAAQKRSSFGTGAPNPRAALRAQPGPKAQDNSSSAESEA